MVLTHGHLNIAAGVKHMGEDQHCKRRRCEQGKAEPRSSYGAGSQEKKEVALPSILASQSPVQPEGSFLPNAKATPKLAIITPLSPRRSSWCAAHLRLHTHLRDLRTCRAPCSLCDRLLATANVGHRRAPWVESGTSASAPAPPLRHCRGRVFPPSTARASVQVLEIMLMVEGLLLQAVPDVGLLGITSASEALEALLPNAH